MENGAKHGNEQGNAVKTILGEDGVDVNGGGQNGGIMTEDFLRKDICRRSPII